MPFFNFRRTGRSSAPDAVPPASTDSVEVIRTRARHRLIGTAVLVLVGVVGFPLLFDTQPRPVATDIPIEIPGKTAVKPLPLPPADPVSTPAAPASAALALPSGPVLPASATPMPTASTNRVTAAASLNPKEVILPEKPVTAPVAVSVNAAVPAASATRASAVVKPKPDPKTEPKPEPKPEAKPAPVGDDAARARALLEGRPVASAFAEAEGRWVVQIGAFADVTKAREARLKLEKAGLKTYTQVAETKDGKRIRVRVGPFASRADADKAASKIKGLDLPAAILTL